MIAREAVRDQRTPIHLIEAVDIGHQTSLPRTRNLPPILEDLVKSRLQSSGSASRARVISDHRLGSTIALQPWVNFRNRDYDQKSISSSSPKVHSNALLIVISLTIEVQASAELIRDL
jgi:hypothetical protein